MKRYVILLCLLTYGVVLSQKVVNDNLIKENRKKTVCLFTASILPYVVTYQTIQSTPNLRSDYFYSSIWFSFGVVLDISAIDCVIKNKRYKEAIK